MKKNLINSVWMVFLMINILSISSLHGGSVKVNFIRPSGWGGKTKFVDGDGQKYLQLVGDTTRKNNQFYYSFYYMPQLQGEKEISFTISCKQEKQTSGKYQIGVYEFVDKKATKSVRFQAVDVPVSANWQTITKRIKLSPKTNAVRFYFLGRNAGDGDTLLVRSLEFEYHKVENADVK